MKECFLQLHFSPALTCFYYHKFVNLGPFRVNLSKSGLGYSVGDLGFRIETTAHGGKFSSSITGSGVSYRKSDDDYLVLLAAITHWNHRHKTSHHFD